MTWLALFALWFGIRDIDGVEREPLKVSRNHLAALFFIAPDCPVSNYYAHEIRRICDDYAARGLSCSLVYVDPTMKDSDARKHAAEYGHGSYPRIVDRKHALVAQTGVTVTPEAVVVRGDGAIAYRGRVDNYYAALGRPRRIVTEHDLRDALDAVFAGRTPATPVTKAVGCYIPDLSAYQ